MLERRPGMGQHRKRLRCAKYQPGGRYFAARLAPRGRMRPIRMPGSLLGFLRARLVLFVEPFLIAERLPELAHGGIEVARFAGLQGFREQGSRKRPARQLCKVWRQVLVDKGARAPANAASSGGRSVQRHNLREVWRQVLVDQGGAGVPRGAPVLRCR